MGSSYQLIPDIIIYNCAHGHMHTNSFFLFNSMITVRPFSTSHCIHTHPHRQSNTKSWHLSNDGTALWLMHYICVYIANMQNDAMQIQMNYTTCRDELAAKKELEYRS